jgi:hypothetical protein
VRKPEARLPKVGESLPVLIGKDLSGKRRDSRELRNSPLVVLVFCGCGACAEVARRWGMLRAAGLVPKEAWTVVLYQGSVEEAKSRMRTCGLVGGRLWVLPDPASALSEGVLHANPCPRALVVAGGKAGSGKLRYVSVTEQKPDKIAESAMQVLQAIQATGTSKK